MRLEAWSPRCRFRRRHARAAMRPLTGHDPKPGGAVAPDQRILSWAFGPIYGDYWR
jgi:hypothetical protein